MCIIYMLLSYFKNLINFFKKKKNQNNNFKDIKIK